MERTMIAVRILEKQGDGAAVLFDPRARFGHSRAAVAIWIRIMSAAEQEPLGSGKGVRAELAALDLHIAGKIQANSARVCNRQSEIFVRRIVERGHRVGIR